MCRLRKAIRHEIRFSSGLVFTADGLLLNGHIPGHGCSTCQQLALESAMYLDVLHAVMAVSFLAVMFMVFQIILRPAR